MALVLVLCVRYFDNVILEVSQDTIVLMSQKTFGRCGLEPKNKTSSSSFAASTFLGHYFTRLNDAHFEIGNP